jgi:hypothetical protein
VAAVVSVLEGRGDAAGGRRTSGRCRIVGTIGQARKAIKVLQEPKPVGNRERIHCAADAACIVRDGLATRARSITIWQRPCRMNLAASASQGLASSKSGQGGRKWLGAASAGHDRFRRCRATHLLPKPVAGNRDHCVLHECAKTRPRSDKSCSVTSVPCGVSVTWIRRLSPGSDSLATRSIVNSASSQPSEVVGAIPVSKAMSPRLSGMHLSLLRYSSSRMLQGALPGGPIGRIDRLECNESR